MRITKLFWYTIYIICVVGLSVVIAMAFRPGHATAPAATTSSKPATKVATSSQSSQSKSTSAATNQATQPASSSTSELTDTGPGDVAGLFIVVSLGAAAAHRRYIINRHYHSYK